MSYLSPIKISVGVIANSKQEAEEVLTEKYTEALNFKIIHLDNATPDIAKQLMETKEH